MSTCGACGDPRVLGGGGGAASKIHVLGRERIVVVRSGVPYVTVRGRLVQVARAQETELRQLQERFEKESRKQKAKAQADARKDAAEAKKRSEAERKKAAKKTGAKKAAKKKDASRKKKKSKL